MHAAVDVHDTPLKVGPGPYMPTGLGVLWIDQLLPSQTSATAAWLPAEPPPTAVQVVAEAHDAAVR